MKTLYTAEAVVTGEGRDGHARSLRRHPRRRPRGARRRWAAAAGRPTPSSCSPRATRPASTARCGSSPAARRRPRRVDDHRPGGHRPERAPRLLTHGHARRRPAGLRARGRGAARRGGAPGLPVLERHARQHRRRPRGRVTSPGPIAQAAARRRDGRGRHRPLDGPARGVPEPGPAVGADSEDLASCCPASSRSASARRCSPPGSSPGARIVGAALAAFYIADLPGQHRAVHRAPRRVRPRHGHQALRASVLPARARRLGALGDGRPARLALTLGAVGVPTGERRSLA